MVLDMWPGIKRNKTVKVKRTVRPGTCSFCGKGFDWNIDPGIVNGAKKEFCGHECFRKNIEQVVRHDYGADFDNL